LQNQAQVNIIAQQIASQMQMQAKQHQTVTVSIFRNLPNTQLFIYATTCFELQKILSSTLEKNIQSHNVM